jgi:hypothetical protein
MLRNAILLLIVLAFGIVETGHGASSPAGRPSHGVRFLSLNEALILGFEHGMAPRDDVRLVVNTEKGDQLLIAHVSSTRSTYEIERDLNKCALDVVTAYWDLHAAYWTLSTREHGLRLAQVTWKNVLERYLIGQMNASDVQQMRGQVEMFWGQRWEAQNEVHQKERKLRALLGLIGNGADHLVPSDLPVFQENKPDGNMSLSEALMRRPELSAAQTKSELCRLQVYFLTNIRPTLWYIPVQARKRALQSAQSQLARTIDLQNDQKLKVQNLLAISFRRLDRSYDQMRANRAQRAAFGEQLRGRNESYLAGRETLDILLEGQRFYLDSLANEHQATASYNQALAGWEFAKRSILVQHRILLSRSAVPRPFRLASVEEAKQTNLFTLRSPVPRTDPLLGVLCAPDADLTTTLPSLFKSSMSPSLTD